MTNINLSISAERITEMIDSELLDFLALRYNTSAGEIVRQFLIQNETPSTPRSRGEAAFTLESNEMDILRDYYNRM